MKVERPKIMNTNESTTEEAAKEPVQAPRINVPKTDTVETKENSFYNFDSSAPKLDPSQTNIAKPDVAAGSIPGLPFREKVELAKTLPDGKAVDSGLTADPGVGKTWTGPNRMGVDIAIGGVSVKNQLDDALKLRQGSDSSSTPSSKDTFQPVTANQIGSHGKVQIDGGLPLNRPGMNLISAEGDKPADKPAEKPLGEKVKEVWKEVKDAAGEAVDEIRRKVVDKFVPIPGANDLLDGPATIEKVTGDSADLVRGGVNVLRPDVYVRKFGEDNNKYVNPEADESIPAEMTPELMEKINIRKGANTRPSNEDIPVDQIDSSKLKAREQFGNPQYDKVKNPLPETQSVLGSPDHIQVVQDAEGPDTVNPNDPDQ